MTKIKIPRVKFTYKIYRKGTPVKITSNHDAFDCLLSMADFDNLSRKEQVIAVYLDRNHNVIGASQIAIGGVSGCVIDPKIVFGEALLLGASGFILGHNHPSGNMNPSEQDKYVTRKLVAGSKLLDMVLLDHIIFSDSDYISLQQDYPGLFGE